MLATHFTQVGLKLPGPVPIAYLHWPLHLYFSLLNILETVEMWLDAKLAAQKSKPVVVPSHPYKFQVQIGATTTLGCLVSTQPQPAAPPCCQAPQTPWLHP